MIKIYSGVDLFCWIYSETGVQNLQVLLGYVADILQLYELQPVAMFS